jgi:hypothetical protein
MEPRKGPDAMEVEWQGQVNVGATTVLLACLPVGMLIEKMSDRLLSTLFLSYSQLSTHQDQACTTRAASASVAAALA